MYVCLAVYRAAVTAAVRLATVVVELSEPRVWYLAASQCGSPTPTVASVVSLHATFLNPGGRWARQFSVLDQGRFEVATAVLSLHAMAVVAALGLALVSYNRRGECT